MVAATTYPHKPKARQPFVAALAEEFGLTKGHVHRVLTGERTSPKAILLRRRQRELIEAAARAKK